MILVAGLSDIGGKRSANEDRILMDVDEQLFAVADGMGGARCGGRAAELAVATLREYFCAPGSQFRKSAIDFSVVPEDLAEAIHAANERVFNESQVMSECEGMGCTLSALAIAGNTAYIGHVGDSRVYLYRDQQLLQLTRDDSVVEQMIAAGEIRSEEAASHPLRNVLLQSIGTAEELHIQMIQVPLHSGDRLLLSSDGLHGVVGQADLAGILDQAESPAAATRNLIQAALDRGGPDNVSCIVIDYE
jgi:protein phosphatase